MASGTHPTPAPFEGLDRWLAPRLARVDDALRDALAGAWPPRFAEAMAYPVFGGGKRVRPALVLAAFDAVTPHVDVGLALAPAAAVELVHTYSLVHDDLPCMDDDDVRRGRPTVHVAYGEAAAVLVGDGLLTEAFAVLAEAPGAADQRLAMIRALALAAGGRGGAHPGMVAGQAADIGLDGPITEIEALTRLHAGKTGALLTASAVMGGIAAGADSAALAALDRYGRSIGLAFQLADDVLDADEVDDPDGPPSFVRVLGVDETRRRAAALAADAAGAAARLPRSEVLLALARFVVERDV